jgi:hypothetical protein
MENELIEKLLFTIKDLENKLSLKDNQINNLYSMIGKAIGEKDESETKLNIKTAQAQLYFSLSLNLFEILNYFSPDDHEYDQIPKLFDIKFQNFIKIIYSNAFLKNEIPTFLDDPELFDSQEKALIQKFSYFLDDKNNFDEYVV